MSATPQKDSEAISTQFLIRDRSAESIKAIFSVLFPRDKHSIQRKPILFQIDTGFRDGGLEALYGIGPGKARRWLNTSGDDGSKGR